MDLDEAAAALERVAAHHAGLCLLVVHGSRSRHQAHPGSDWDLGYVAADRVDPAALHADAARVLGTDDVDVVDLARASALLRFCAAAHGRCVFEATPGAHEAFVLAATLFWCDAEAVIRRAQAAVLADLSG
jgi:hypothetical protein